MGIEDGNLMQPVFFFSHFFRHNWMPMTWPFACWRGHVAESDFWAWQNIVWHVISTWVAKRFLQLVTLRFKKEKKKSSAASQLRNPDRRLKSYAAMHFIYNFVRAGLLTEACSPLPRTSGLLYLVPHHIISLWCCSHSILIMPILYWGCRNYRLINRVIVNLF